jgi:hypothetical protein
MEKIELDLDDENEMIFKVQIEGSRPGEPMCRLMIESGELTHSIQGEFLGNSEVKIVVPPMKSILREGSYDTYLEVLVDDRVFIPLEMKVDFEKTVKVVAESVHRGRKKPKVSSASLINTRTSRTNKNSRREKTILQNENVEKNKSNTYTEQDILDIVKKLKRKVK